MWRARSARHILLFFLYPPIAVARSSDESATLEGTASQANSERSTPWGKKNGISCLLYSCLLHGW